jgi:mono/diheme cytochrome c family protein
MLQRLLIEKIENRILVGTVMFLGIMVLIGWLAINETGRMQAFEAQFLGRSIERGAELFASNCTSCHGTDGRGLTGVGPALNNPSLFGHNFFADIDREEERLNSVQLEYDALLVEREGEDVTSTRQSEIDTRLAEITAEFGEDVPAGIAAALGEVGTQRAALTTQMQGAIEKGYDPEEPNRLEFLGWGGSLNQFIHTTLIHGRPTSVSYWPNPMVSWAQEGGGPLRDDQVEDLVNYITNWDREWTLDDLLAVNQFAKVPGEEGSTAVENPVGTDVPAILTQLETLSGDPLNGQTLYNGALGCAGCHSNEVVAPLTQNTWPALQSGERLSDPALTGYTPEQYLVESIVNPDAYIVPGYTNAMPDNFGERLDAQMLADIIAYLESYDGSAE